MYALLSRGKNSAFVRHGKAFPQKKSWRDVCPSSFCRMLWCVQAYFTVTFVPFRMYTPFGMFLRLFRLAFLATSCPSMV